MKHFVTLFLPARKVHLTKDVGQIPYQMQRHFGYRSTLVCYKNEDNYRLPEGQIKGLNLQFLEHKGAPFFWENAAVQYLFKNAKEIDVLQLYHLKQETMLYGFIYKFLNPWGQLYLKMDMDTYQYSAKAPKFSDATWKQKFYQKIYPYFIKCTDIISVESQQVRQKLQPWGQALYNKSMVLLNGIDEYFSEASNEQLNFEQKENLLLTVGRIGSHQKNSEMLMQALANMDMVNWKMVFAGPIKKSFKPKIAAFFKEYPTKRNQIVFTGEISDRKDLLNYYKRAKIFCLPSRWESFGIVLAEALSMGNYIIGTDKIPPMEELTKSGQFGTVVESENVQELQKVLQEAIQPGFYTEPMMHAIRKHADQFRWPIILEKLEHPLQQNRSSLIQ